MFRFVSLSASDTFQFGIEDLLRLTRDTTKLRIAIGNHTETIIISRNIVETPLAEKKNLKKNA
jgi:hypothetical protein